MKVAEASGQSQAGMSEISPGCHSGIRSCTLSAGSTAAVTGPPGLPFGDTFMESGRVGGVLSLLLGCARPAIFRAVLLLVWVAWLSSHQPLLGNTSPLFFTQSALPLLLQ